MSIGREESLFLTVSEDHRQRAYPEYVQRMSAPFSRAGGMVAAYEGVLLGGADKRFGLDELNLWLRRYRYAAYDMDVLLPAAHLCLERAVRADLMAERPGVFAMARFIFELLLLGLRPFDLSRFGKLLRLVRLPLGKNILVVAGREVARQDFVVQKRRKIDQRAGIDLRPCKEVSRRGNGRGSPVAEKPCGF